MFLRKISKQEICHKNFSVFWGNYLIKFEFCWRPDKTSEIPDDIYYLAETYQTSSKMAS